MFLSKGTPQRQDEPGTEGDVQEGDWAGYEDVDIDPESVEANLSLR